MQETICAKVNPRLLTKASRLFTGSLEGRIIEILQNSRRAGATEVRITNKNGLVTVQDNGSGIDDFQKLLDLGGSGWDDNIEQGEDPAGVGLFSLAPRQVTIVSGSKKIVIDKNGWTGTPVQVTAVKPAIKGTQLTFAEEESWDFETVEEQAVFTGMRVIVDGKFCHSMPFCSQMAAEYADLGCRIEVAPEMSKYHKARSSCYFQSNQVLVNFHGQVVELDYWPSKTQDDVYIFVDLTRQTQIRLMLPARTCLVENDALKTLKAAIEVEYYRFFQRQKEHCLWYDEYLRAKELGIDLPEAKPVYGIGLIHDEYDLAVEVTAPKNFKLSDGYLCLEEDFRDEYALANVHLLAALGTFSGKPLVPVMINDGFFGYSWANLPKITSVKVIAGKERLRRSTLCRDLVCVESLAIKVQASDGKVFASDVSMAIVGDPAPGSNRRYEDAVYVTQAARQELENENLWYHLGGYNDEGDSFETQQEYAEQDLSEFWNALIGPHESFRQELLLKIRQNHSIADRWQKVVIEKNGDMTIHFKNGKTETVKRPAED